MFTQTNRKCIFFNHSTVSPVFTLHTWNLYFPRFWSTVKVVINTCSMFVVLFIKYWSLTVDIQMNVSFLFCCFWYRKNFFRFNPGELHRGTGFWNTFINKNSLRMNIFILILRFLILLLRITYREKETKQMSRKMSTYILIESYFHMPLKIMLSSDIELPRSQDGFSAILKLLGYNNLSVDQNNYWLHPVCTLWSECDHYDTMPFPFAKDIIMTIQ